MVGPCSVQTPGRAPHPSIRVIDFGTGKRIRRSIVDNFSSPSDQNTPVRKTGSGLLHSSRGNAVPCLAFTLDGIEELGAGKGFLVRIVPASGNQDAAICQQHGRVAVSTYLEVSGRSPTVLSRLDLDDQAKLEGQRESTRKASRNRHLPSLLVEQEPCKFSSKYCLNKYLYWLSVIAFFN